VAAAADIIPESVTVVAVAAGIQAAAAATPRTELNPTLPVAAADLSTAALTRQTPLQQPEAAEGL
jgi:hypothetical protein